MIQSKVKDWILQKNLISSGDTVVCAVSGGADSVVMLDLLFLLKEELGFTMEICHLNHGLRGDEADGDEVFVLSLGEKYGCKTYRKKVDIQQIAKHQKISEETAGRNERYSFFTEIIGNDQKKKIAIAHTVSDQLETMLFHLIRGTGIQGLTGIPAKRGQIIRPIGVLTRTEVEEYASHNKIVYRHDSSNDSLKYTRNQIRKEIIPKLKTIQPEVEKHAFELSSQLAEIQGFIEEEVHKLWQEAFVAYFVFQNEVILSKHLAIQKAFFKKLIESQGISPTADKIHQCVKSLVEPTRITLGKGKEISSFQGVFRIENIALDPTFEIKGHKGKIELPDGRNFLLEPYQIENSQSLEKVHEHPLKNQLNYDKIDPNFILRTRKEGDFFAPANRGCTKSLKKLFNEAKMSSFQRKSCIIAADNQGIFWVEGFGVSQRVFPDDQCQNIYEIKIEGEPTYASRS